MELFTSRKTSTRKHLKYIMSFLYDAFPDFDFFEDDGSELFHDALPNVSSQSIY